MKSKESPMLMLHTPAWGEFCVAGWGWRP